MDTVIVTRHAGLVEWLRLRGITGTVIEQATAEDVRGKRVVGALPPVLAVLADSIVTINMPGLKRGQSRDDLTPEEMDAAGAELFEYMARRK